MNTPFTRTIQCIVALAVMSVLALPALAANPGISATLEPSHVAVGEAAQLTVTVIGGSGDEPALPHVDGLKFTPTGQSNEYQSVNGVVSASSSYTYLVTATRAGKFTIPAMKVGNGSSAETTRPIVLQVSAAAPNAGVRPAPALPAPNVTGADDDQAVSNNGQQAFLRLVIPKRTLHVGELVPVQIKAYFRGGVQARINGLPALSSDAFTLNCARRQTGPDAGGDRWPAVRCRDLDHRAQRREGRRLLAESGTACSLDSPRKSEQAARPVRRRASLMIHFSTTFSKTASRSRSP